MSADNWKASVNAQPPEKPRLTVSGRVVTNTGGYKVELAPLGTDLNPKIVTVRLTSTPPSGPAPQVVTTIDVPPVTVPGVQRELEKVVVLCGDGTLTEITDIPTTD